MHTETKTILSPPAKQAEPSRLIAEALAEQFAATAIERDRAGGTPQAERDLLRQSGLLKLAIPRELGGLGASWSETLDIVRRFAQVDSSVAHVFAFQHLMMATVRLFGSAAQTQEWLSKTARHDWFWGNALNPLDRRTLGTRRGEGFEFHGQKSFCSGATDSDMLIASAFDAQQERLVIAAVPTAREGITVHRDWDNMGQRQTDSGSVTFDHVLIEQREVLSHPGPFSSPFACLRSLIAQLILTHIYLGLAEGALASARAYTLQNTKPWMASPAASANEDLYVLAHYGEFRVALEGASLLTQRAARLLDEAWQRGLSLTEAERGEVAIAIATAKVAATRAGLDLTSRMFDVAGARATHAGLRLDRFWRNLRTHSLHDPVDYKLRELGDWTLNARYPKPTFYS